MIKSIENYKTKKLFRDILLKKNLSNTMTYPKIDKILISLTNKEVLTNSSKLFVPLMLLKLITSQKPKITDAKKSIAQFKLRQGKATGCKIVLRKNVMYSFLDKLVYSLLPQILETRTRKLNSNLNSLTVGIEDLSIFSELENQYELLKSSQGLNINLVLKNNHSKLLSNYFFSGMKIPV
jgi:large subunit ribosomal protein L5